MRTLLFALFCVAAGYGIAKYSVDQRLASVKHQMGSQASQGKSEETQVEIASLQKEIIDTSPATSPAPATTPAPLNASTSATATNAKVVAKAAGKIEVVDGLEYDFGTMKKGTKRSHTFIFRNVGGSPIKIAYQSSTCKCTVGKLKDSILEPGEQTDVELEWVAENASDQFAQVATLSTDAPSQEEIKITIKGKISEGYVFEPATLDFGDTLATEEKSAECKMYLFDDQGGELESAGLSDSIRSKYLDVKIGENRKLKEGELANFADAKQLIKFTVTIKKGMPAGRFTGSIQLKRLGVATDGDAIMYSVQGKSASVVSVVGGRDYSEENNILTMGTSTSKLGLKKSVILKVRHLDGVVPTVKVGKIGNERVAETIRVTVGEAKVSSSQSLFPITIEAPAGCKPCEMDGTFSKDFGKIVFETNIESAPEFPMFIKFKITD